MATKEEERELKELSDELHRAVSNIPQWSTGVSECVIDIYQNKANQARQRYRDYREILDNPEGKYNPF